MKKIYCLIPMLILFFFSSCERFDPPEIKLQMTNEKDSLYTFYAIIINGGGKESFRSKGCVYGLINEPTLIKKECNSFEIESPQENWFFEWSMLAEDCFPIPDTTYYVKGFVKTNAGIGYSNFVRVETKSVRDTI